MGQYKVPQDVEAEDTLIGPLTMRQFFYVIIGLAWGAITFAVFRKLPAFFVAFGVPVSLLFILLGVYKRQDQPFEKLFLALINYWVNPRKRLWEKEPIEQIFMIEPEPPKAEPITRDSKEIKGQLEKLVHSMESQGATSKRPELQEPAETQTIEASDRIFLPKHFIQRGSAEAVDVKQSDDVLDVDNNPSAHSISELIEGVSQKVRDEAIHAMQQTRSVKPSAKAKRETNAQIVHHDKNNPRVDESVSKMTATTPDDMLKQTLASSNLRVNQIAERANPPQDTGQLKEGESVKIDGNQGK